MKQNVVAPVRMPLSCADNQLRRGVVEQAVEVACGFMTRNGIGAAGEHGRDDIRPRCIEPRYAINAARNTFQSRSLYALIQECRWYAGWNELPARYDSVLHPGKAQNQCIDFGRSHA